MNSSTSKRRYPRENLTSPVRDIREGHLYKNKGLRHTTRMRVATAIVLYSRANYVNTDKPIKSTNRTSSWIMSDELKIHGQESVVDNYGSVVIFSQKYQAFYQPKEIK